MNRLRILFATLFLGAFLVVDGTSEKTKIHVFKISNNGWSEVDWWKTATFYQIYPRSFRDSDNDGNGDIRGITKKLDYLKDTGIDAIWLSPVYKSPQIDNGYDISDYRDVDSIFGTLDDLRELIDEAHKLNIKVLLDYVPNHTSDQHKWFQASLKRDPKYDDYYIWKNATYVDGKKKPPNNWRSHFKDSTWEWNEGRQQYYFHQFTPGQPDLNYRNPKVVEEMKDVLRYWLNFGADGFRMDVVNALFEDILLRDEPPSGRSGINPNSHHYLNHIYTMDQPETVDMIYQWREVLDEFNSKNKSYNRIMVTELYSNPQHTMLYYGTPDGSRLGAHFTFNFITFIMWLHEHYTASDLTNSINKWLYNLPKHYTSNWVLGNHDKDRVSSRLGVENIDAINMLVSILPGAQFTYQGEEIGQENGEVACTEGFDPLAIKNCSTFQLDNRDVERTPFQWDNSTNAGFNDGAKPWLPVSKKYMKTNLAKQNVPGINSHYNIYRELLKLKREFRNTSHDQLSNGAISENIFYAQRETDNANYVLYYNVGDSEQVILDPICTDCMTVAIRSINSDYTPGDKFNVSKLMKPREAVLSKVTKF